MNNPHFKQLEQAMTESVAFDDQPAQLIHLENSNGVTVSFMDIGATWVSCHLPIGENGREVLLRSPSMAEHKKQTAYFGSIVGRYANRIAKGTFEIDGECYQVGINNGANSLHGGVIGLDKFRWNIDYQDKQQVVFFVTSPDGDQGYPGELSIKVTYTLTDDNEVSIAYQATTNQATPVNLTNHAYFNLAGESTKFKSLDHTLQLEAPYYLPTNDELIPTGELKPVQGTSFDFTQEKVIKADFLTDEDQQLAGGYDHAFIFDSKFTDGNQVVATLTSPEQDLTMQIRTSKPAIQFYSGNFLAGTAGKSKQYELYDGLALETQFYPDGPNHPEWREAAGILKPDESYNHSTVYHFHFCSENN